MEAVILFFKSGLGKSLLIGAAVLVLLWGVYEKGHVAGREEGYKEGMAIQQPIIDKLTKTINDERTATAIKVKTIEKKASDDVIAAKAVEVTKILTRDKIVNHYNTVEKVVASQCGLSKISVDAINALLDTQIVYPDSSTPGVFNEN